MILTGKAKQDFLKYYKKRNKIKLFEFEKVETVFKLQDYLYKNALIIEWFDSVGIYINIVYEEFEDVQVKNLPIKIKTWSAWINGELLINFNSRQQATEEAIKKACEIYNKN